jgi:amino acid adenylation domain-containing protein
MNGSYQLNSFTENKDSEVRRLQYQVNLFFEKEFEIYEKSGLRNGMKIIECGSGPGFLIKSILNRLPECDATALEIDPFLVSVLRENSIENGTKLFDVRHASIYDTQLPDNTFDFAITRLVFEHLQKPFDALRELKRILKPGGKLVVVSNDFAYHILTYPVIPELDEMYRAYCDSRFSEGGNPLVGRQMPAYMIKEEFSYVKFEVLCVHSDIVGDKALLQAENVNISKSLVTEGFLKKETLDALAENWYKMLQDPDHVIYRQLFVISGEKGLHFESSKAKAEKSGADDNSVIVTQRLEGLNRQEQENEIKSFLSNQVKRIMGDNDLILNNEKKLNDIDVDSIAAAELSGIVKTNFNKSVSISDILQKFCINDIAALILESSSPGVVNQRNTGESENGKRLREDLFEISAIQEQFWILHKVYPENTAYNIPSALEIRGDIDITSLEKALNKIIERHEILRVSFSENNEKVYQKVRYVSEQGYKLEAVKVDELFSEDIAGALILEEVHQAFDLTIWPLFRIKLFTFNNSISVLSLVFHHSIIDLRSRQVLAGEISDLYNSYISGITSPILNPVNKYSDYSKWLNGWLSTDEAGIKKEEWMQEIPKAPEILQIAPDFPRPKVETLDGKRKSFEFDSATSLLVTGFARENKVNEFTVFLAAYSILLNRLSNQSQIVIGVPLSNRRKVEFADTFGCFVNIVPVLVDFHENITVHEIIMQIRQSLLRAHRKQEVPFLIINNSLRASGRNSIFQAGFTFEPPMELTLNNLDIHPMVVERNGAQLDLFLTLWEQDRKFSGYLEYSTLLYKEDSVIRFIDILKRIVGSLPENQDRAIAEIPLISENDYNQLLEFNDTDTPYEDDICIHRKFEEQVRKNPELPALLIRNKSLNYKELDEHANRMANYLISRGVVIEDKVGICIDRSLEMMICIFGVLKAGAAYLPLSPENPSDRLRSIINDANPRLILATKPSAANIPDGCEVVYADDILQVPLSLNSSDPQVKMSSRNLAYVLYTSGSTGTPKGVMIEHHSVLNRLGWMQKAYPIDRNDTLLQKTPITFDVSVWELFWWFFNGARLVMLPKGGEKDPEPLIDYIADFRVTTIHFVPSMFSTFFETIKARELCKKLECLNRIFLSGEALPLKLVRDFNEMRNSFSLPDLINLYGPTEATVDVSYYDCPGENITNVYIGKPIDNTKLFVVNGKNILQPTGVQGELLITGVNLARGYMNRPDLTSEKFFDFRVSEDVTIRAYRSGDLVKFTPESEIDYLGRLDNQVKIRGFRIELGDIEAKILEHPLITHCAVIISDNGDLKFLVAYVCVKPGNELDADKLRTYLSGKLPDYMVPSFIVFLETIPLTSSGKIDRKSLPKPDSMREKNTIIAPSNEMEQQLLNLWRTLLGSDAISIHDNFFDIGGNSLLAINLANSISKVFTIPFNTLMVFEFPNIKDQGKFLSGNDSGKLSQTSSEIDEKMKRKKDFDFRRYRG